MLIVYRARVMASVHTLSTRCDTSGLCQQENNCNYFVFDTKKDWCWLKTNANNQKAQLGSTLGPRYCQNAAINPRSNSDRLGRVSFSTAGA